MDGWRDQNQIEEDILKTDLNYQIGFDEHDDLADALDLEWAPSVYILDHQGIVLSVESLADEKGFWQAMRHRSDPDFQRGVDENLAALSGDDTGIKTQSTQTAQ